MRRLPLRSRPFRLHPRATPMIETLTALLFAHIVADFVLQTRWMVENKSRVAGLAVHGALVGVTAGLTLGGLSLAVLWLAGMHLLTDYAKTRAPKGLAAFAADQAAHLVTLLALALWQPDLWRGGFWEGVAGGAVGGSVARWVDRWRAGDRPAGARVDLCDDPAGPARGRGPFDRRQIHPALWRGQG